MPDEIRVRSLIVNKSGAQMAYKNNSFRIESVRSVVEDKDADDNEDGEVGEEAVFTVGTVVVVESDVDILLRIEFDDK